MYIEDYIQNYNYTFSEKEFNVIDNLVLSQLSYLNFDGIINDSNSIILNQSLSALKEKYGGLKKLTYLEKKVLNMFELLSNSKRFNDAILSDYINIVDKNEQFGAITIKLNDNSKYISFEGSDGSIIGWKENFALTYSYPTKTQESAINYLNKVIKTFDKNIRIGGHSKGGNLAMTAYMECHSWIKNKIINIYNNDGPGFKEEEFYSSKYQKMHEKLIMIVPENSIIGMLMLNSGDFLVVKTNSFGIRGHSVFTWKCGNDNLIISKLNNSSIKLNNIIIDWLKKLNYSQKREMISTLFELFNENHMISKLGFDDVLEVIKGLKNVDSNTKKAMLEILSVLKECLKDNF